MDEMEEMEQTEDPGIDLTEEEDEEIEEERAEPARTGRRLVFHDGSQLENAEAGAVQDMLTLFLKDTLTMSQAAALAFNTEKLSVITFQYGEMDDVYEGYTQLKTLTNDPYDGVIMTLVRGE